jgi:hypothetical protein
MKKINHIIGRIYLTHYEEYPIYEPAEGGYYYAGRTVCEHYEFTSEKQARRKLAKLRKELEAEDLTVILERGYAFRYSRYIGQGEQWYIEHKLGQHESGWHPYE